MEITDGSHAERVISEWIDFNNAAHPHSSFSGETPGKVDAANRPVDMLDKANASTTRPSAQQQNENSGSDLAA